MFVLLVGMAVLVAVASVIAASLQTGEQSGRLVEDFNAGRLDSGVWEIGDHVLGRGALRLENTEVSEGRLRLSLPADALSGGEVNTNSLQEYGRYRARIRVPDSPGSVTGFFLYRPPDYENEVDIEIYNDPSGQMLVTTYAGGDTTPTNTERVDLPFDPTSGFHDYGFDYGPNGIVFYVDGEPVEEFTGGLPDRPMRLYMNTWYPDWVAGGPPEVDSEVEVDSILSPGSIG